MRRATIDSSLLSHTHTGARVPDEDANFRVPVEINASWLNRKNCLNLAEPFLFAHLVASFVTSGKFVRKYC